jgi:hypothetical protein
MHRQDGLDPVGGDVFTLWSREEFLKRSDIKQQGRRLHVNEHRLRPAVLDDVSGGWEGDRRRDHGIPWPNPHRHERQVHGRGAGINSCRELRAHIAGDSRLKFQRFGSGRQPARLNRFDELRDLLTRDQWLVEWDRAFDDHRFTSLECWQGHAAKRWGIVVEQVQHVVVVKSKRTRS